MPLSIRHGEECGVPLIKTTALKTARATGAYPATGAAAKSEASRDPGEVSALRERPPHAVVEQGVGKI